MKSSVVFENQVSVHYTDRHPFNGRFFQDNLGKLAPERLNQSRSSWSKRWWGGSDISWTICKSFAPCSRQITMPALDHSIFYRPEALKQQILKLYPQIKRTDASNHIYVSHCLPQMSLGFADKILIFAVLERWPLQLQQELIRRWDSERELLHSAPGSYPNSPK